MGKKSRRNRGSDTKESPACDAAAMPAAETASAVAAPVLFYPSDGPTEVELLKTESSALQSKLEQLTELAAANDRAGFVQQFVPVDLADADKAAYLNDLTIAPDSESHWVNIASEIAALAAGRGVDRIEGDQQTRAVFFFCHPLQQNCDREVAFCCVNGEWRAEG